MDFGTVIGLAAGAIMLLGSILLTSDLAPFLHLPSLIMVGGGAVCAALVSFPLQHVAAIADVTKKALFTKSADPRAIIQDIVRFAEVARREGILALENLAKQIADPFLAGGIRLAVDGTDPELLEAVLTSELESMEARHSEGKALFDNIGKFAPAFGLIGTLVGLVIMLRNMGDAGALGPAMAVALLTTLYGAVVSNVVALPLAEKLGRRSKEEIMLKMLIIKGVMAIQAGDNPRLVEQKLKTFLPLGLRHSELPADKKAA